MQAEQSNTQQPVIKPGMAVGESASDLVHRHLSDETHETTDEEMRNIQLDLDVVSTGNNETDNTSSPESGKSPDDYVSNEKDILRTPADVLG